MFRGRFEYIIDEKGRTSLPARFREVLSANYDERLIVTTFDNCLWAYPVKEWTAIEDKIAALPQFKIEVKALQRVFVSGAAECPLDKQGRIVIPPTLRDYAGLKKDIVFVGMTKRIEIWSKEKWAEIFSASQAKIESSSEDLANLGL
ncbi:MAG TPA: cell division/cell wall cluster transcriptional repressor MraZ [Deltaproteobacteria bacterium]|nr:cell division/cell wall cluster transcriptional repressor MraZ [Deltaproteobacteria bacterium]